MTHTERQRLEAIFGQFTEAERQALLACLQWWNVTGKADPTGEAPQETTEACWDLLDVLKVMMERGAETS